ncbi:MaoC domain-containing protein dehydratase [Halococcus morrhuae DSM 1307]|uniref:MaoC domain-containing protein dehydratase n=1 Tax=Halococcus morrhuae DSM 1307 TaxID=931277 RepID=M0MT92_HALMO|nr:MaoC/PaaZ C-terminal domain-containing protein [Halococcus morrhuae]EMA48952.1 MaoC domain-containing protein dehydratase [Halococcus morrhuae DSM 1307]
MGRDYFEDVEVGEMRTFGERDVTRAEILEFAERYDPQPFHTDESAASDSLFGGLIASGWHTAAMTMELLVTNVFADSAATGALGVDELRWPNPVRPGHVLSVRTEVIDTEPWDEELGLVKSRTTTLAGETEVMSMVGLVLYERRER